MSASARDRHAGAAAAERAPRPTVRAELRARGLVALTSLGLSAALVLVLSALLAAASGLGT